MVRKVLLMFAILALLLSIPVRANEKEEKENGLTFWMLGDYNVTGLRLGYLWDGRFEVGGLSYWRLWETEDVPQTFGGYFAYHLPGEFDISQIPMLAPLAEQLPSIAAYIGIQGTIQLTDDADERGFVGPMVGTVLNKFVFDTVDDQIKTVVEVRYVRNIDEVERTVGEKNEVQVSYGLFVLF